MERLKMSKISKFESDTSHVSDDIAPQSCKNFTFKLGNLTNSKERFSVELTNFP